MGFCVLLSDSLPKVMSVNVGAFVCEKSLIEKSGVVFGSMSKSLGNGISSIWDSGIGSFNSVLIGVAMQS